MRKTALALLAAGMALSSLAFAGDTPAPANAYLYIGWPNNGEVIRNGGNRPFRVWFGLRHMGVAPAGVDVPNTGHHHLLVNTDIPPLDEPIPADDNHLHFGRGQTQTQLSLPKGEHTLQLIMGDHAHVPHSPPITSPKITIRIE